MISLGVCLLGTIAAGGIATAAIDTNPASTDSATATEANTTTVFVDLVAYEAPEEYEETEELITALQDHAETHQQSLEDTAEADPGITIEKQFWLANAARVTVNTTRTDPAVLGETQHVETTYTNLRSEPASTASSAPPVTYSTTRDSLQAPLRPNQLPLAEAMPTDRPAATWGIERIGAPRVWTEYNTRGNGTRVAVLDTGVAADHPDIDINDGAWSEFDADGDEIDSDPFDPNGHGTHVSGTVVGGNESGQWIGVAPDSELLHGKVFNDDGAGTGAQLLAGLEWALIQEVDVINLSLGITSPEFVEAFIEPVQNAEAAGIIVAAASGNAGPETSSTPGNVFPATAVGATDEADAVANFSSSREIETDSAWDSPPSAWPDVYTVPDLTAPGVGVRSAHTDGDYRTRSGTSMATPHVAGAVALVQAATPESLSPTTIRRLLAETAIASPDTDAIRYGDGRIDAAAAVDRYRLQEGPAVTATLTAPDNATIGAPVTLDATGSTAVRDIDRYEWTFDNESTTTTTTTSDPTITRAFSVAEPRSVNVSVTVVDTAGATATANATIAIQPSEFDAASITGNITNSSGAPLTDAVVLASRFTDTAGNTYQIDPIQPFDDVTTDAILDTQFTVAVTTGNDSTTATVPGHQLHAGYDFADFPMVTTEADSALTLLALADETATMMSADPANYALPRSPAQPATRLSDTDVRADSVTPDTETKDNAGVVYNELRATQLRSGVSETTTLPDVRPGTTHTASFVIQDATPLHESGVTQAVFDAVDQNDDGQLSRSEIRTMIRGFIIDRSINDVALTRSDVRTLVRFFIQNR